MPEENAKVAQFNELYNQGLKLLNDGKDDEAMAVMYQAAKFAPEGWLALALQLIKDGHLDLALERLREVVKLTKQPKVKAAALNNIGMLLANSGKNDEAMDLFRQSVSLAPEFADTYSNIALLHKWSGNYERAIAVVNKGLDRDPWHEQGQFIRAMAKLMDCRYKEGFAEYECRWRSKTNGLAKIVTPYPEWNGTNGNNVLLYGEQGAGDAILMMRFARNVRARNIRQMWVAQKNMAGLFGMIPEIDQVIAVGDNLPDYDSHLPYVSLPHVLDVEIGDISGAAYMTRPEPVDFGPGFHVGVCWRGSKSQGNDMFRSTRLGDWISVLSVGGVTFHSLQVENAEEGLLFPQLTQHPAPADWAESAKRVCGLDLVISVDTSIVHLCGALGVPCWCALHCRPYFVYPLRFKERTPWYDSVRLYRQNKELQWQPVFEQIANDLTNLCKTKTT